METANLLEHDKASLSNMVDLINKEIKDQQMLIRCREDLITDSDEMSEALEKELRDQTSYKKKRLEDLYAWRVVFLNAWGIVNKRELIASN